MTQKEKKEKLKNLVSYIETPSRLKQMIFSEDDDLTTKTNKKKWEDNLKFIRNNGFARHECWNLDMTIATFIYPRLKYFRKTTVGFPTDKAIKTIEDWHKILDDMIFAFGEIASGHYFDLGLSDSKRDKDAVARIKRGLKLFHEYYFGLWW